MKRVKSQLSRISVVVAVRNVEETVGRDVRRLAQHLRSSGQAFEILAVNDGCRDNSLTILRLVAADLPELRVVPGEAGGRPFVRGAAEATGQVIVFWEADRAAGFPLATLGWAMARVDAGRKAVIFRGRCIVADRMASLAAVVRSFGRGDLFERTFERNARSLDPEIIGNRSKKTGLFEPVLRFLAA